MEMEPQEPGQGSAHAAPTPTPAPYSWRDPVPAWLALGLALLILLSVTAYPPMLVGARGHVDHAALTALCWAMSAGFVRGVGFVPRLAVARWVFSGWALLLALGLFFVLR